MRTKKANVTIEDIAKELGVSKTTVSRAISGKGRISQETAQRVMECIQAHNYVPAVPTSRTGTIALAPGKEIPLESMEEICREAARFDYDVLLIPTGEGELAALERAVARRKVDGVLLAQWGEEDPRIRFLTEKGIPFGVIGALPGKFAPLAAAIADDDQVSACRDLTGMLLAGGQGPLALMVGRLEHLVNQRRMEGYFQAHRQLGLEPGLHTIYTGVRTREICVTGINAALEHHCGCILCTDEEICRWTVQELCGRGLIVGEDVGLACLTDSPWLAEADITALAFDWGSLGRTACRGLLESLQNGAQPLRETLGYRVHLRASTQKKDGILMEPGI